MPWVPLHIHSQYSILDSTISIPALVQRASQYKLPALALTDQGNLYGAVDFFKECKKEKIKPILGCELYVAPASRFEKKKQGNVRAGYPIVLLVKDETGYRNLCKLSSKAHLEGFYYTPRIDRELLAELREGLICLSGPMSSRIAQYIVEDNRQQLEEEICFYRDLFGSDFYLELTRHGMSEESLVGDGVDRESWLLQAVQNEQLLQEKVFNRLLELSASHHIPCVATNDTRYLDREDWRAHEILGAIASGEPCEIWERDAAGNPKRRIPNPKRRVTLTHEYDFKSLEAMEALFHKYPQALEETTKVAEKCQFAFDFSARYYPVFIPPQLEGKEFTAKEREEEAASFLRTLCKSAIEKRYNSAALEKVAEKYPGRNPLEVVHQRLAYELDLIISKGLGDYLLIVYDFIAWAKSQKIPMGPGRGSGAGSIVCYLTGITDIEPLRFSLFFERFINPERISYPDIDVDMCMERRQEVIEYTVRKYGKEKVAQIITFGTMKAKMAIKDVGRVLSIPLSKVNDIAKLIPEDPNMTLEKALELDPDLRRLCETDPETARLLELAKKLEGSVRNTGIHAAGMIISAGPIMEHIPVCNPKDSPFVVTQYAMKPVEAVGMLKVDFLGLKTLTAIQLAVDAIGDPGLDWVNLPLDDRVAFDLLNQGKVLGLFQLESGGMQDLIKHLHIDTFEEIIAVNALYRPGPMEMIPSFIRRKHGKEPIEIEHPLIADILAETYGIMVYQEQVMQIASILAGYSLGEGDVLRRAMGKKDHGEMARQREKFRLGAIQKGVSETVAMVIFDKIEKFASYGFNKSHAAAYGYLSYVTAYLKAHFPMHWMAALLTTDRDDLSKVTKVLGECQTMNIAVLLPDVNESAASFVATSKGIRFALGAIKGIGQGVVEAILEERKKSGSFKSLADFIGRLDTHKVGKKATESLIEAGAFDFTKLSRSQLLASVDPLFLRAQKEQKLLARGQLSLFGLITEDETSLVLPTPAAEIPRTEILKKERELLGFYLTGHPLDEQQALLQRLCCIPLGRLSDLEFPAVCRCAFVIEELTIKLLSKNSRKFAVLVIGDKEARFEMPIWSELYEEKGHLLAENRLLYAILGVEQQDEQLKLTCHFFEDLAEMDERRVLESDAIYDKVRLQQKSGKKWAEKAAPQKEKDKPVKPMHIKINLDTLKLSHILQIKNLLSKFPGKAQVALHFYVGQKQMAELTLEAAAGVSPSAELIQALRAQPAVFLVDFQEAARVD
jgi:DNA polymerase-3 subunit alpha